MFKIAPLLFGAFALASLGCATSFTGKAHLERKECESKCTQWGMKLIGMVGMGEYSDGCICKVESNGTAAVGGLSDDEIIASSAGTSGAAVGVVIQTREAAQSSSAQFARPMPY